MKSLQEVTDAWGAWYSKKNGTTCRFTASTNYGSQSDLSAYKQYQVSAVCQAISYDGNSPPTGSSVSTYELWYDNGSSVQNQQTFTKTATSTQTFTWSITEALSIGVTISATEGVPSVASSTQSITATLSLSSTQGQTVTNTQTWSVNSIVNVPPNSSIKADMIISQENYDINFTQDVKMSGYVAIWNNDKVNGHWLWFIPISSVFQDCVDNNIIDTTGYTNLGNAVSVQASGVFTGSQGVSVGVSVNEYPLRTSSETPLHVGKTTNIVAIAGAV